MTSENQIVTNRQNALKSTGPKSENGKHNASQNATKHGLLSKTMIVHGEAADVFEVFRQGLFDDLKPEGTMETLLVEKITANAWRLRRAIQAEAVMMHEGLSSEYMPKTLDSFFAGCLGTKMNNISRYESMLSKHFYRAFRELRELQSSRKDDEQAKNELDFLGIGFVS